MAVTTTPLGNGFDYDIVLDSTTDTTPEKNVRNGTCQLRSIELVNSDAQACYLKLYDNDGSALTPGTTAPDFILPVAGSGTVEYEFPDGHDLDNGLSFLAAEETGDDVTTSPATLITRVVVA